VPDGTERIEAKVRATALDDWACAPVFCACTDSAGTFGNPGFFSLGFQDQNGTDLNVEVWAHMGTYPHKGSNSIQFDRDDEDHVVVMDGTTHQYSYDAVAKTAQYSTYSSALSPLCILGGKSPRSNVTVGMNADSSFSTSLRLYSFKVYDKDGTLVFDAVPARDDNATVYAKRFGVYDLVGGRYYPNNGTTKPFLVPEGCEVITHTLNHDGKTDAEAGAALVDLVANVAMTGDIVKVGPGTYALSAETGPVVLSSGVKLVATDPDCSKTIIDANYTTNCVRVTSAADAAKASISGFTLTRGSGVPYGDTSQVVGGGIFSQAPAGFVVSNCAIRACRAWSYYDAAAVKTYSACGAALYASGNITLCDVRIEENTNETRSELGNKDARFYPYSVGAYLADGGTVDRCIVQSNVMVIAGTMNTDYHQYSSFYLDAVYMAGSTQPKIVRDSVFEGNRLTNTVLHTEHGTGNGAVNGEGALAVKEGKTLVERCLFRNNRIGEAAGVRATCACEIRDCTFATNVATYVWGNGAALAVNSSTPGCITLSGCDFDGNVSSSYAADIKVEVKGLLVSNCVFRGESGAVAPRCLTVQSAYMTNTCCVFCDMPKISCVYYANAGDEAKGNLIDRCLFKNVKQDTDYNGFVYPTASLTDEPDAGCRYEFRNSLFVDCCLATFYRVTLGGSVCEHFRVDACSFIDCTLRAGGLFNTKCMATTIAGASWQDLVGFHNTHFHNTKDTSGNACSPFNTRWGKDYPETINNCAYNGNDVVMAERASNLLNVTNPKFKDAANGNYMPRVSSPLREKGVKSDWMDGATDLGEGFGYETGAYTIHPCGETYRVGATVAIKNPRPRVAGTLPDIGACEYFSNRGLMLLVR